MSDLDDSLGILASWLDGQSIPYMVIDGFAVTVWGEPRMTRDLDVTVSVPPEKLSATIQTVGSQFTSLVNNPIAFVSETRVLPILVHEVPVDYLDPRVEELADALADQTMLDWYRQLRKRWS